MILFGDSEPAGYLAALLMIAESVKDLRVERNDKRQNRRMKLDNWIWLAEFRR